MSKSKKELSFAEEVEQSLETSDKTLYYVEYMVQIYKGNQRI